MTAIVPRQSKLVTGTPRPVVIDIYDHRPRVYHNLVIWPLGPGSEDTACGVCWSRQRLVFGPSLGAPSSGSQNATPGECHHACMLRNDFRFAHVFRAWQLLKPQNKHSDARASYWRSPALDPD